VLRVVLSLLTVVAFAMAVWGMYRGWCHRAQRQQWATGEFPAVPDDPGPALLGPTTGLYVGSTIAGDWQDRVAVGDLGFRATAELTLHPGGVLLARAGASAVWIPLPDLESIRTDRQLAGKVTAKGGLLVLRWAVGQTVVDTGFRGDGTHDYPRWLSAVGAQLADRRGPNEQGQQA
jgi:hypothetical protein